MDNIIDKLILEWSWRCEKGYPDINNPKDLAIFNSLLVEYGIHLDEVKKDAISQNPADYTRVKHTLGTKDKLYYLNSDLISKDNPRPGAPIYRLGKPQPGSKKTVYYIEPKGTEDSEIDKNPKTGHADYIKKILNNIGVPPVLIDQTISNSKFQSATTIEDFKNKLPTYIEAFSNLFKYSVAKGGRGELIPLVSIKGATLGTSQTKDITVKDKVLEVKELSGEEFALASGGSVINSIFDQNFSTFRKYLEPFEEDNKGVFRFVFSDADSAYTVSKGYLKKIEKLVSDFPLKKDQEEEDLVIVKVGDEKFGLLKNRKYEIEFDEKGNLTSGNDSLFKLDIRKTSLQKLLQHPWVTKKSSPIQDLNIIREKGLKGIDYLLLYTKGNPVILDLNKPEEKNKVEVHRVAQGTLNLKYTESTDTEEED